MIQPDSGRVVFSMSLAKQYPTIKSLPAHPIRLRGTRTIRRLTRIVLGSPFCMVASYYAICTWLLGIPAIAQLTEVFLILGVMYFPIGLLLWFLTSDIEISADGLQNQGRFRNDPLFRWDDFANQRVDEGSGIHSYKLLPPEGDSGKLFFGDSTAGADDWIQSLIHSVWIRPTPEPPSMLYVRQFTFDSQVIVLSDSGLTIVKGDFDAIASLEELSP